MLGFFINSVLYTKNNKMIKKKASWSMIMGSFNFSMAHLISYKLVKRASLSLVSQNNEFTSVSPR